MLNAIFIMMLLKELIFKLTSMIASDINNFQIHLIWDNQASCLKADKDSFLLHKNMTQQNLK